MTRPDGNGEHWLNDSVHRVRFFAAARSRPFPPSTPRALSVGSDRSCWLCLNDSEGEDRVSKHHGDFILRDGKWRMRDAGSTNGILVDGLRCDEFILVPAQVIHLSGATLIVESHRTIAVHAYLSRVIGWNNLLAVDLAMRALRRATMREAALVLHGPDDLISIAHTLHCLALGSDRPFVVSSPTSLHTGYSTGERRILSTKSATTGLLMARHGSLCVFPDRLPRDYVSAERRFHHPDAKVMLIRCAKNSAPTNGVTPVEIPPLVSRASDLPRIITEYVQDAGVVFGIEHHEFPDNWTHWIIDNEARSLGQIERATQRLVALRMERSVYGASKLLGLARQTMADWIANHGLPEGLQSLLTAEEQSAD
jgi:hypothetical protein